MAERKTGVLIIGAGPYGLSLAAQAQRSGINHIIVGEAMSFWRDHMPKGMFLRSECDWHLDPGNTDTIEAYLRTLGQTPADVEPLSLDFYLGYAEWFRLQNGIYPLADRVLKLDHRTSGSFVATLASGDTIDARRVVIALGFGAFRNFPNELTSILPEGSFGHTCDEVDLSSFEGKRVLIVGGRQSAYEWAALLNEAGATAVDIVHRHPSPVFAYSDWSWVGPLVDQMGSDPAWYRRLPDEEKRAIASQLYAEGRLKLEPWLQDRIEREGITVWPETQMVSCDRNERSELDIDLSSGVEIVADHIILATGYKVQIDRLPLLASGNILAHLESHNGFPVLDEGFQTNLPGLYITSFPAAQEFGPFFGFTIAARASAWIIGQHLAGAFT